MIFWFFSISLDGSTTYFYWTSASTVGCRREFGWCASNEMLDYDALNISLYNTLNAWDPGKMCLVAKLLKSLDRDPMRLTLNFEEVPCEVSIALIRAICEVNETKTTYNISIVFLFDRSLSNTSADGHSAGSTDALKR